MKEYRPIYIILISVMLWIIIFGICHVAFPAEVDMAIIAEIESSNNPDAYNAKSGAVGMYQITLPCLRDYNSHHMHPRQQYDLNEMYNPGKASVVANWYMNERIPGMLRYHEIPDTVSNRLIAYNWGIGNLLKWQRSGGNLPEETANYIRKYKIKNRTF